MNLQQLQQLLGTPAPAQQRPRYNWRALLDQEARYIGERPNQNSGSMLEDLLGSLGGMTGGGKTKPDYNPGQSSSGMNMGWLQQLISQI